jgi:hypothetical protein
MTTRKVRYVGPHDEVTLDPMDAPGTWQVKRNHAVEVPTDLAKRLLEQVDIWQEVTDSKDGD